MDTACAWDGSPGVVFFSIRRYRAGKNGDLRPEDMNKFIWGLSQLKLVIDSIENLEMADRVLALEERLGLRSLGVRRLPSTGTNRSDEEQR